MIKRYKIKNVVMWKQRKFPASLACSMLMKMPANAALRHRCRSATERKAKSNHKLYDLLLLSVIEVDIQSL